MDHFFVCCNITWIWRVSSNLQELLGVQILFWYQNWNSILKKPKQRYVEPFFGAWSLYLDLKGLLQQPARATRYQYLFYNLIDNNENLNFILKSVLLIKSA